MFRKLFIFYLFYLGVHGFPSFGKLSGKLANSVPEITVSKSRQTEVDAAKNCSQKFPEVPHDLATNVREAGKIFKAGEENLPSVRCFIACVAKTLLHVEEDGKINFEKLPGAPISQTVNFIKKVQSYECELSTSGKKNFHRATPSLLIFSSMR